jgi:septum formation protein
MHLTFRPVEKVTSRSQPLVLASRSPARSDILKQLGLSFTVDPADIDESIRDRETPAEHVADLAYRKALTVSSRHPAGLVVGVDTVGADDRGIIGKPEGETEARAMLERLSGKSHQVVTGLAIIDTTTGAAARRLDISTVTFRSLSPATIERYIRTGEPLGKAGAYALQGLGAALIEKVEGDYHNVLGLSIAALVDALEELGYELI